MLSWSSCRKLGLCSYQNKKNQLINDKVKLGSILLSMSTNIFMDTRKLYPHYDCILQRHYFTCFSQSKENCLLLYENLMRKEEI